MNRSPSALLPVLAVLIAACSEHSINKVGEGIGGDGPAVKVHPDFLDFGSLDSDDEPMVRTFTITSVGASPLTVSNVQIQAENTGFALLTDITDLVLDPEESFDVDVEFFPVNSSETAEALVFSDDPDNNAVPVELYGEGTIPALSIEPDPMDFGNTYVGCAKANTVDITSVGSSAVTISGFDLTGDGFAFASGYSLPITLEPGESTSLDLTFTPTAEAGFTGQLTVTSDEPLGSRTATQTGEGKYGAEYEDEYVVPTDPATDIMFIVDQSCSMADDARSLADNFGTFITELSTYSTDWQIIVANNDRGCNTTGILTPSTSGYQATFVSAVQDGYGTWISDTEALMIPAAEGVGATDAGDCNDGFLREDALLHIVLVSDEPEQSGDWGMSSDWQTYADQIIAKKGSSALTKISAVAGDVPGGCTSATNSAEPGTGYYEAVAYTDGVYLSICSDWGTNVEALAEASINQDSFPLSHSPVQDTIVVTINGTVRSSGWSYDAADNAVVFTSGVPEEGDVVNIAYAGAVDCD